jgi:hypothetical protein
VKNEHDVYVFTEKGAKLNARFAITVDEPKKEETKKPEPVKTEVKQEEKKAE